MRPDRFRGALRVAGLRQRLLAAILGVSISTVNRWATGVVAVPGYAIAFLVVFVMLPASRRADALARIAKWRDGDDD